MWWLSVVVVALCTATLIEGSVPIKADKYYVLQTAKQVRERSRSVLQHPQTSPHPFQSENGLFYNQLNSALQAAIAYEKCRQVLHLL